MNKIIQYIEKDDEQIIIGTAKLSIDPMATMKNILEKKTAADNALSRKELMTKYAVYFNPIPGYEEKISDNDYIEIDTKIKNLKPDEYLLKDKTIKKIIKPEPEIIEAK